MYLCGGYFCRAQMSLYNNQKQVKNHKESQRRARASPIEQRSGTVRGRSAVQLRVLNSVTRAVCSTLTRAACSTLKNYQERRGLAGVQRKPAHVRHMGRPGAPAL